MEIEEIKKALIDLDGWIGAMEGRGIEHYLSEEGSEESLKVITAVMTYGDNSE